MVYTLDEAQCQNLEISSKREWLLTNGLGGFAMGTVSGVETRRYHGLLVAAIHPPADRMVLLAAVDAFAEADGNPIGFSSHQYPGAVFPEGYHYLREFKVQGNVAEWHFRAGAVKVLRRVALHSGENAVTIDYVNESAVPILLTLRPLVCHKPYHSEFAASDSYPEHIEFAKSTTRIAHDGVELTLRHDGARRTPVQGWYYRFEHDRERERGLPHRDDLYCPAEYSFELLPGPQPNAFGREALDLVGHHLRAGADPRAADLGE